MSTLSSEEIETPASQLTKGAIRYLGKPLETLSDRERSIFDRLAARKTISRDVNRRLTSG